MAITVERLEAEVMVHGDREVERRLRRVNNATNETERSFDKVGRSVRVAGGGADDGGSAFRRLTSAVGDANTHVRFFSNAIGVLKWPALIAAVGLASTAITTLTGAVAGLTAALMPLGGLLAALPSAIAGIAAAATAGILGFGGIGDALKAYTQVSTGATAATNNLASAQRAAVRASRDLAKAQQELAEARAAYSEDFEDAQFVVRDAVLSEQEAILQLERAYERLQRAQAGAGRVTTEIGKVTDDFTGKVYEVARVTDEAAGQQDNAREAALDYRRAQLAVEQAIDARQDAERRLRDMERKGVEGSEKVVAALERVASAQEQVVSSQEALQRSSAGGSAASSKLREALAALSPAGRRFVDFIRSELQPRLKELRTAAQEGLLPGVQRGIQHVLPLFPQLRDHIGNVARIMGGLTDRAGQMVSGWGPRLKTIFSANEDVMRNLGDAGLSFADALSQIMVHASPMVRTLSGMVRRVAELFNTWVQSNPEKIRDFFDRTVVVVRQLGRIIGNLGRAFGAVLEAARPLGEWIMRSLVRGTDELADNAQKSIPQMRDWFNDLREPLRQAAGLIGDIVKVMFRLHDSAALSGLIRQLRDELLPALEGLFKSADKAFTPALVTLISNVATAFATLMGHSGALTLYVKLLGGLVGVFNRISTASPAANAAIASLASSLALLKVAKLGRKVLGVDALIAFGKNAKAGKNSFGKFIHGFRATGKAEGKIANLGLRTRILAGQIGGLAKAGLKSAGNVATSFGRMGAAAAKQGATMVASAGSVVKSFALMGAAAIKQGAIMVANLARMVAHWVVLGAQSLLHAAKVALAWVISMGPIALVIAAVVGLVYLIVKNWKTIWRITKQVFGWLWDRIKWVFDKIVGIAKWLVRQVINYFTGLIDFYRKLPGRIWGVIRNIWDRLYESVRNVVRWVRERFNDVVDWFKKLPNRLWLAANRLFDWIHEAAKGAVTWIKERFQDVIDWFKSLPRKIINAAGKLIDGFKEIGKKLWEWLKKGFEESITGKGGILGTIGDALTPSGAVRIVTNRQYGGPVKKGVPTVVGEKRPELFVPSSSGRIAPTVPRTGTSASGGLTDRQLERLLATVADKMKPNVTFQQEFNEKVDPKAVSSEIAWRIAS